MSSLFHSKISLKIPSSSPKLSCTDKRSENARKQHGGSLFTRFIESVCACTYYIWKMHRETITMTAQFACHNVTNMCILNKAGTVMVAFVCHAKAFV